LRNSIDRNNLTAHNIPKRLAVLGSTGSIGRNTLEVAAYSENRYKVVLLSAHKNLALLEEQINRFHPETVVVTGNTEPRWNRTDVRVLYGSDSLCQALEQTDWDILLSAIVGSAGLQSTICALELGKTVALANKESLVVGGSIVTKIAERTGGRIIPVDSEHSAVWQSMMSGERHEVERLILTASGGPFRCFSKEQLKNVTVEQALAHPTWNMGQKITIDSATLMNKALEIIEARWLFDIPAAKINVMLHPQSVVHSMVEFVDGAVLAQLSPPDMRLPIQWALDYPNRFPSPARKIHWEEMLRLEFFPPDAERFPAISLGLEVARIGGTAGAILNAANETAVEAFLNHQLPFHQITTVCQSILEQHNYEHTPTPEQLWAADRWGREETKKWISR
jgi:1-deoxy-D-xylulose-5-phosphate reductoisomerase